MICAVNGYALGLGATVALMADVVYIGRSGVLGDTHVNMGIGAGDGGGVIWPMLVGPSRAKYFLMTGEHIRADQAKELGLVHDVVEDDDLLSTALALAERLSNGPLAAISASKVPINKWIKHVSNLVLPLSLSMEEATMSGRTRRKPRPPSARSGSRSIADSPRFEFLDRLVPSAGCAVSAGG